MPFDKSKVFQSNYLKADDIPTTGVDATIESTWEEEVDYGNGKGPQMTGQVKFTEFSKPLGLNTVNCESIEALLGKDNAQWDGGTVRLYRTTTRNPSGAVVPCIRIQPPLGQSAAAATGQNTPTQLAAVKTLIAKHKDVDIEATLGHETVKAYLDAGGTLAEALKKLQAKYEPESKPKVLDYNFNEVDI